MNNEAGFVVPKLDWLDFCDRTSLANYTDPARTAYLDYLNSPNEFDAWWAAY